MPRNITQSVLCPVSAAPAPCGRSGTCYRWFDSRDDLLALARRRASSVLSRMRMPPPRPHDSSQPHRRRVLLLPPSPLRWLWRARTKASESGAVESSFSVRICSKTSSSSMTSPEPSTLLVASPVLRSEAAEPPPPPNELLSVLLPSKGSGSVKFSASSKAVRIRRRISVACSSVLRPGAKGSHSGWPK